MHLRAVVLSLQQRFPTKREADVVCRSGHKCGHTHTHIQKERQFGRADAVPTGCNASGCCTLTYVGAWVFPLIGGYFATATPKERKKEQKKGT
mgnify:CR=1 FL=1